MSASKILPKLEGNELTAFQAEWNQHPGMRHMGAELDLSDPHVVRAVVDPIRPEHRGGLGTDAVNGAVIAGVFDLVIGLCGYLQTVGRRAGVAQLSIQFLRPVHGSRFEVVGHPVRAGNTLVFATSELRDERGTVCARCDGIVAVSGVAVGAGPAF
ncbi:MAG: PaaI family thioesterase [Gemmatimonadales bacterium]|jgi:acyl-coenzyme A thioesterase PaaI-like protein